MADSGIGVDEQLVDELLAIALDAAASAGRLLIDQRPETLRTSTKSSATDVVTEMDRRSEELIRALISAARPTDAVLGEEGGNTSGASDVQWIVDPIDGTVNYLYDLPQWSVSIAAAVRGEVVVGVVAVPPLDRTYYATINGPAICSDDSGDTVLQASDAVELGQSLLATGFGYRRGRRIAQAAALAQVLPEMRDVRRGGSAAIDMCLVAAGNVDAYYERGVMPWDVSAAALIAARGGAVVGTIDTDDPEQPVWFAAAPGVASEFRALLVRAEVGRTDAADDADL